LIKAYAEGKRLVVMADITGFLKSTELDEVFSLILKLRDSGMTFIIIEVYGDIAFKWADRLSIIRDGKTLGIFSSGDIKKKQIFSALLNDHKKKRNDRNADEDEHDIEINGEKNKALEFVNINTQVLKDLNFSVGSGEVAKIYYMDNSSCSHIIELLKGMRRPVSGRMLVAESEYRVRDVHQAVDRGVCIIEESPYQSMFIFDMSIMDNLCLPLAKKVPLMWVKKRYGKSIKELVSQFIDVDIEKVKLSALSHVQLQQLAYLKWYMFAPSVVVCVKPFTEVDIHIREVTVEMIGLLQKRGISVIILTPNFSETYLIDGDTLYIKDGRTIGEDEVYQIIYGFK
jgi:ABC-type sugar transport system ATPase subunit